MSIDPAAAGLTVAVPRRRLSPNERLRSPDYFSIYALAGGYPRKRWTPLAAYREIRRHVRRFFDPVQDDRVIGCGGLAQPL